MVIDVSTLLPKSQKIRLFAFLQQMQVPKDQGNHGPGTQDNHGPGGEPSTGTLAPKAEKIAEGGKERRRPK